MKKKLIITLAIIVISLTIITCIVINTNKKSNENNEKTNSTVIYDKNGNIIYDISRKNEITDVIKDTVIQGKVESKSKGYIYIFNGQHFGEFGLEMEEYTRAIFKDNNQTCIDYLTLQKYDTSYIQEGDILICSGDLSKKGYSMGDNDFDTKDNAIIVLKSNVYKQMKRDALIGKRTYSSSVTIGDEYIESGYVYLKYSLEDDTHSDTGYNFPFAVKAHIEEDTKVTGDLKKGKRVKVTYKDENADFDNMKLQSIEIIENQY